jgi:cell division septal protein FtsQ
VLVAVAALPLLTPWWRVQAVEVRGCPGLPKTVTRSLQDLVGLCPLALDPQWVRRQVEVWPVVETVDVRLQLPATVQVSATRVVPSGSVPIGRGWQAVAEDGNLAGSLESPLAPVLKGFANQPDELRLALRIARRLERSSGGRVEVVRFITPADIELRLHLADMTEAVVHVQSEETEGERYWCDLVARGEPTAAWADLRWDDRIVFGGGR